ncbi:calcium-responsive transactivator isoform X1 [Lynx rufus]|uniref:calcium-responsive transactivator isoform X1 n=3 Tax=Lynx rufus TaxID=61384 RepID=UPI001F12458C|nr:calcium-responsive transactivator isoform X1 [Lynx rufus]
MSVAFASARPRGKGEVTQQTIQKMLDENHHLIQCILDYQSKGKTAECTQYQQILHRNLVYLATIADSNQNMQSLLPAPPTQNMNLGPGALSQSGSSQGLHSQGSLSDAIGTGLPPSSLMQGQIGNGPNHVSMQQTAQSTLPTTSMSMSGSGHGTGPGYSHSGPASQSVPLQGQGAIGNYVSRANINMQSNPVSMMHQQAASSHYNSAQGGSQHYQGQSSIAMMGQSGQGSSMMGQRPLAPYRPSQQGSSQQYLGQEEYYGGEQYGHGQAASEPMSQQYYPDGHGDYAYQQSYTEQSYDRSFEESTQHYYEGGKLRGAHASVRHALCRVAPHSVRPRVPVAAAGPALMTRAGWLEWPLWSCGGTDPTICAGGAQTGSLKSSRLGCGVRAPRVPPEPGRQCTWGAWLPWVWPGRFLKHLLARSSAAWAGSCPQRWGEAVTF